MKKFFKFLFKGLVNNEEVIYESKKQPWWTAIIVFLLSLVIAVVPSFVQITRIKGAEVLTTSQNASLDTSLILVSQHLEENNIKIEIDEQGKINVDALIPEGKEYYQHTVVAQNKELLIFTICKEAAATNLIKNYSEGKKASNDIIKENPYSSLIITEDKVYLTTYLNTSKNVISNGAITESAKASYSFVGLNESAKGTDINSFYATKDIQTCLNHWETFLNDLYKISKTQYLWGYTGVLSAINLGVALLVSLLTMILTRLKSATGEKLNYLNALQIIAFASLAPAAIGCLLGFVISSFAQIGFVLCLGLRATFLGMKAANPNKQN